MFHHIFSEFATFVGSEKGYGVCTTNCHFNFVLFHIQMSTYCSVDLDISLWYGWVMVPSHENQMSVLNGSYDSCIGNA